MRPVIAKRQGIGSTAVRAAVLSLALMVGVLWFLGDPGQVHACKCAQPGAPSEGLEKFSAVFAGRAVSIQHSYDPKAASVSPEDRTTVGFEVSAVWKGTVHEDMYITTPPTGGSCGFTFVEGEEYIVYGHDSNYADGGYGGCHCWHMQSDRPHWASASRHRRSRGGECSISTAIGGPADQTARRTTRHATSKYRRTSARRTTRHATSKYRRLQPTGLGNSPGRGNRRSPGGWRRGPNGPQSTTQPTENGWSLLNLTSRGVATAGSYR